MGGNSLTIPQILRFVKILFRELAILIFNSGLNVQAVPPCPPWGDAINHKSHATIGMTIDSNISTFQQPDWDNHGGMIPKLSIPRLITIGHI